MAKMVDRIRKALGLPVRIDGAAYTDEWWGDVPPAAPQAVIDGVQLAYAGLDFSGRTPTTGVPQLQFVEEEDERDWEEKLREAKARAAAPPAPAPKPVAVPPAKKLEVKQAEMKWPELKQPEPKKLEIKKLPEREPTLTGMPKARIPETPSWMEDGWSAVISRAKEKSAKAAVAAGKDEEDWDAVIRRAKKAAI